MSAQSTIENLSQGDKTLRLLQSEKRVLSQVAAGVPLSKALGQLVLAVEAESNGEMCGSILLLDGEGERLLHGAAPNLPVAYCAAIHGVEIGEAVGSCGTAAHRGEAVFVTDIATDPLWAAYRDLPLAHGLRACWSIPIRGAGGRLLGTFGNYYREPRSPTPDDLKVITLVTHTAALAIERHLSDEALKASEQRFRTLVEVSPQVVWFCGADGEITYCNPYWHEFTGLTLDDTRGGGWMSVVHSDHLERIRTSWSEALGSGATYEAEIPFKRASDGEYRWFVARGMPVLDGEGQITQWVGIALDIHERKQAEQARELLGQELAHRIKNIFTVISGLSSLTARQHPEAHGFVTKFRERLVALATAHDYGHRQSHARGADSTAQTVQGLIAEILRPYAQSLPDRFDVVGNDAYVGTNSATALALIMHEQATNAVKYGALSNRAGRVRISGNHSDGGYTLTWSESGGPKVAGPPEHKGFGTVMAAQSTAQQLGGVIDHEWATEGLTTRLTIPLTNLAK
jgi:PAS domain S-box-containing protein